LTRAQDSSFDGKPIASAAFGTFQRAVKSISKGSGLPSFGMKNNLLWFALKSAEIFRLTQMFKFCDVAEDFVFR
jgi:hypothetical protein